MCNDTLFPILPWPILVRRHSSYTPPEGVRGAPYRAALDDFLGNVIGKMVGDLLTRLLDLKAVLGEEFEFSIITNAMPDWIHACADR